MELRHVSASGDTFCCFEDGRLVVCSRNSGTRVRPLEEEEEGGGGGEPASVATLNGGTLVYVPEGNHRCVARNGEALFFVESVVYALKLRNSRLAVAQEHAVRMYDLEEGRFLSSEAFPCQLSTRPVLDVTDRGDLMAYVAPTGRTVYINDGDSVVHEIDAPLGVSLLSWSPSTAKLLAVCSADGTQIDVWSVSKEYEGGVPTYGSSKLFQLRRGANPSSLNSAAFSPDESLLAVAGDSGTIHIWELSKATACGQSSTFSSFMPSFLSSTASACKLPLSAEDGPVICSLSLTGLSQGAEGSLWVATSSGQLKRYVVADANQLELDDRSQY